MNRHWISVLYSCLHPSLPKFGSIAALDLGNTPESMEGLRILREWIWQACNKLSFSIRKRYNPEFIPEFMPVCTMAYDFDFERAQVYVPYTRMCSYGDWPQCLTRPGIEVESHFIVRDFVTFLQGGPPQSLILGTLYLRCVTVAQRSESFDLRACRQILVNHIPVDAGHFCDAVERLCGSFILSYRFMMEGGALHGITLPRSWFISLLRSSPPLNKDTSFIPHFVNDTIELLRRIDLQREHHRPRGIDDQQFKDNGSSLNPLHASACIARM